MGIPAISKNIKLMYAKGKLNNEKAARECGKYYYKYKETLKRINPFARYIVLKLTRPILDLDYHNDYDYGFQGWESCKVYLEDVDKEIERCLNYMKQNCKDKGILYILNILNDCKIFKNIYNMI